MQICALSDCTREERRALAKQVIGELNCKEERFPENASNLHIMEEIIHYLPQEADGPEEAADYLIEVFQENNKNFRSRKRSRSWMPWYVILASWQRKIITSTNRNCGCRSFRNSLRSTELRGYEENAYQNGRWMEHEKEFVLSSYIGLVDDPENQMQYPLMIDLATKDISPLSAA